VFHKSKKIFIDSFLHIRTSVYFLQ
jgi:hypothetical protein